MRYVFIYNFQKVRDFDYNALDKFRIFQLQQR